MARVDVWTFLVLHCIVFVLEYRAHSKKKDVVATKSMLFQLNVVQIDATVN